MRNDRTIFDNQVTSEKINVRQYKLTPNQTFVTFIFIIVSAVTFSVKFSVVSSFSSLRLF